ncbi:lysylphosphatidylglycerol synthase domain-containing protein [Winogradskyella tangerina]|uniref:lysylphosphatidylglycerol synthase domain-containing protein n=1 Tax=Winogradskyella tangerina TaxID=2023240 RepID=UPI000DBE4FC0|nr:lysylphosphatidylglycerol synthase domain-containing protein [Winogradskyella tangerina]
MLHGVPYKTKQFLFVLIKLSIVVGAFYFIYSKLAENEDLQFGEFLAFLKENGTFSVKNIVFLVILSLFNWFFEILKWKNLASTVKKISFKEALEQSLGGHTASLITPNRIGDYGAKAAYYIKSYRKRIVLMNLLGNMAQMTITTIFGVIGVILFVNRYQIEVNYQKVFRFGVVILIIGVLTTFGIKQKAFSIKGYSIQSVVKYIKQIASKIHLINLSLSLIRYLIFSFQFYYLLQIFGVEVDYLKAMVVISSMYLLASIIPSISIFDVIVKGSVAVFLFGYVQVNELTILSIITIMWILNFAIPALFGGYFALNFKLPKIEE